MDDSERIEIAKDYIAKHRISDVDKWQPFGIYGNDKYLTIYQNMISGLYGTTHSIEQHDENCVEYNLEVSGHDTSNGKPVLFWWFDDLRG